jgi:hypothetical protein
MSQGAPRPPDLVRRPPALTVCGICRRPFGPELKATDDHILPKGFFSKPVPDNLPTWRVCESCQDALDPAEERLRNLFARDPTHDPEANQEVLDRAQRSGRAVVPERWDWVMNNMDLYEFAPIARADERDLNLVFSKMVGGLFYWKHHRLNPKAKAVVRGALSRDDFDYWTRIVQFDMKLSVQRLGQVAWVSQSDPELRSGFWLFVLHDALGVGVWAGEMARRRDIPKSCAFPVRV